MVVLEFVPYLRYSVLNAKLVDDQLSECLVGKTSRLEFGNITKLRNQRCLLDTKSYRLKLIYQFRVKCGAIRILNSLDSADTWPRIEDLRLSHIFLAYKGHL